MGEDVKPKVAIFRQSTHGYILGYSFGSQRSEQMYCCIYKLKKLAYPEFSGEIIFMGCMCMLRFTILCALVAGVSAASADDNVSTSRLNLPALSATVTNTVDAAVQKISVDATASLPEAQKDPFQGYNRAIYRFNDAIDRAAVLPTAKFYQRVVPKPINTGISNFFQNLGEPWTAVNQLLQGKPKSSTQTLGRFTLNTLTSLGFADPANSSFNLKVGNEDFGQTMGVWGVKSGPYLMLPLLGPSTLRDATGKILDMVASPTMHIEADQARIALTVTNVVDTRAAFIGAESVVTGDQYPVLRDVYLQRRLFQVFDGMPPARLNPPVDEGFGDEEFENATPTDATPTDATPTEPAQTDQAPVDSPAADVNQP